MLDLTRLTALAAFPATPLSLDEVRELAALAREAVAEIERLRRFEDRWLGPQHRAESEHYASRGVMRTPSLSSGRGDTYDPDEADRARNYYPSSPLSSGRGDT